ncbi:MAG: complex I subunit 1/NuoH family protein, partial [Candidatus Odinarchaeia archaeon]
IEDGGNKMVLDIILNILQIVVFPGIIFLILMAFLLEWIDRKYYADLQNRMGPMYVGWRGILQPFADFIKLMAKEDITPAAAEKNIFTATPIFALVIPLLSLMFLPIISVSGLFSFQGDLIFLMFLTTLVAIVIFLAGYSSMNRFSSVGAARAGLQLIGYEIPLTLAILTPALIARSFTISEIVEYQAVAGMNILIFPSMIAFGVFMIAALAELEKVPLDIPEAETEIIMGWQTEFSGKTYAFFRLSNDLELLLMAGLAVTLFLGGPYGIEKLPGLTALDLMIQGNVVISVIWYTAWFVLKTAIVTLVLTNLRTLFSRYRIDQMIRGSWRYLTPIMIGVIIITQVISVAAPWMYPIV